MHMAEENTNTATQAEKRRMLVVRFDRLGEIIQCMGFFQALHKSYPKLHKTILTNEPYAPLLRQCPYFDEVWVDNQANFLEVNKWRAQITRIAEAGFANGIDCQNSSRSHWYYRLLGRNKPFWVCSMAWSPVYFKAKQFAHLPFQEQIETGLASHSGIEGVPPIDLSWLEADISHFDLPKHYIMLLPGSNIQSLYKRWPETYYFDVIRWAAEQGVSTVICGTEEDAGIIDPLVRTAARLPVVNLMGRTSHAMLASIARGAMMTVGNETGPIHIASNTDCPTICMSNIGSDTKPGGRNILVLHDSQLDYIRPTDVMVAMAHVLDQHKRNITTANATGMFAGDIE